MSEEDLNPISSNLGAVRGYSGTHRDGQSPCHVEDKPPCRPVQSEELAVGPEIVDEQVEDPGYQTIHRHQPNPITRETLGEV